MLTIEAIDHLVLNAADVEISAGWYERVLGRRRETAWTLSGKGSIASPPSACAQTSTSSGTTSFS